MLPFKQKILVDVLHGFDAEENYQRLNYGVDQTREIPPMIVAAEVDDALFASISAENKL